jgi:hypothetical protein
MFELLQAIPDVEVLLKLEPEELGAKLLFLLRKRTFPQGMSFHNLESELWPDYFYAGQVKTYPAERRADVTIALS